jgi:hypothetical protein
MSRSAVESLRARSTLVQQGQQACEAAEKRSAANSFTGTRCGKLYHGGCALKKRCGLLLEFIYLGLESLYPNWLGRQAFGRLVCLSLTRLSGRDPPTPNE